jgi:hypothetical protein
VSVDRLREAYAGAHPLASGSTKGTK